MGKKSIEIFGFTLKLFIFLQVYTNCLTKVEGVDIEMGTAVAKFQSEDGITLKARMTEMEGKNRQQDKEISNLKTKAEEDRKIINRLEDRLSMLEAVVVDSKTKADGNVGRRKRPYRLLAPYQPNM